MRDAIDTPRLRLEPLLPEHAGALFEGLSDSRIYEHLDERAPASLAALDERYRRLATRRSPDGRDVWLNWAVFSTGSASYIGYVQATLHPDRTAEIAYVLFPASWGRGYATEAVSAMIAHLREQHRVAGLVARIHPANRRSIALVTALGFARDRPPEASRVEDEVYRL